MHLIDFIWFEHLYINSHLSESYYHVILKFNFLLKDWAKAAASRISMKTSQCVHLPLQAVERHLLSSRRWQSWLAVTHLLAEGKSLSELQYFQYFLCVATAVTAWLCAVSLLTGVGTWCTLTRVPTAHPARGQHLWFGLYQVITINLVLSSFGCRWWTYFWGCLLQCGFRMSKYSASGSGFGIFTFLHFLGFLKWLMNSIESIYTCRWALAYKSVLCTHVSH